MPYDYYVMNSFEFINEIVFGKCHVVSQTQRPHTQTELSYANNLFRVLPLNKIN